MSYDGGWWPERKRRLPGKGPPRAKGRRPFGESWWGRAWIEALEQRARLDPNRLPRGRTYARTGAVGTLEIAPGQVRAEVQGSRRTPYKVTVRVRTFTEDEWRQTIGLLASAAGHLAALLDGELPPPIAAELAASGLDLLPGAGEVQPRCSCPDWAEPCKHSAATCYLVADALDEDPFQLLLLRGKPRDELLAALRAERASGMPGGAGAAAQPDSVPAGRRASQPDEGLRAQEVWGTFLGRAGRGPGSSAPLPPVPLAPARPGRPAVLAVDPPATSGLRADALRMLAADASARALDLARGGTSTGLELSFREDLARRAALLLDEGPTGTVRLPEVAARVGVSPRELLRWALAWSSGGREGLFVLLENFDPPPEQITAGAALLGAAPGRRPIVWHNRVTVGERQLRLGRDGRWFPFRKVGRNAWEPDGPSLGDIPAAPPGADDDAAAAPLGRR